MSNSEGGLFQDYVASSFFIALNLSMILFLNTSENNVNSLTCKLYMFNANILHFILILPYIFRAMRLLYVFNYKYFNTNFYKTKLREAYYLKIIFIVFIVTTGFYIIIAASDKLAYIFPIDVDVCQNKIYEPNAIVEVFWILVHSFECIIILLLVIKLRHVKDEFNISDELLTVGIIWLIFELFFVINTYTKFLSPSLTIIFDISRNLATIIVSGLLPVIKSFQSLNLPICTTKECAANLNLLLITEKTYNSFYDYLKAYMPEGAKFLSFWTELNVFKHSRNFGTVNYLSTDIYEKYLDEKSDMYIDFPPHLVENFHRAYQTTPKNVYTEAFDSLGEFAFGTLRDYYYPNFKISNEYRTLETELEKDEIIYSRLVASSMISSLEIE